MADPDFEDVLLPGQIRLPDGRKLRPVKTLDKNEYNHILQK